MAKLESKRQNASQNGKTLVETAKRESKRKMQLETAKCKLKRRDSQNSSPRWQNETKNDNVSQNAIQNGKMQEKL